MLMGYAAPLVNPALMLSITQKAKADMIFFYYNRGNDKACAGDHCPAISDYPQSIRSKVNAYGYFNADINKLLIGDKEAFLSDFAFARSMGSESASKLFQIICEVNKNNDLT